MPLLRVRGFGWSRRRCYARVVASLRARLGLRGHTLPSPTRKQVLSTAAKRLASSLDSLLHPRSQTDRNSLLLHADIAFQGIVAGGAGAYLSVFAVRLGASAFLVGLLTALPALLTAAACIPAARYVARQKQLVPVVNRSRVAFRIVYLVIAIIPWLLPRYAAVAIVAVWSLVALPAAYANVSFAGVMAEAVPPERRAIAISTRYAIYSIVTAATLPITGRILETMPFPLNYQVVFALSFIAASLSIWVYAKIRIPDQVPARAEASVRHTPLQQVRQGLREVAGNPSFMAYLGAGTVYRLGLNMPAALFSIFWVKNLSLSDGNIALATTITNVFSVLGYFFWGYIAKRRGHAPVMVASTVGLGFYPLLTASAHSLTPILLASVLSGLFASGVNLAFFNVLLAVAPPDKRAAFVAWDSGTANIVAFIGPLLGTAATGMFGIRTALLISAVVRLVGGLMFLQLRIRE